MRIRGMRGYRLKVVLATALAIVFLLPQLAWAAGWDWCELSAYSPTGSAPTSGITKVVMRRLSGPEYEPQQGPRTRFTASNARTRFYFRTSSGLTRVSRNTFFRKYRDYPMSIRWELRKNSAGTSYRFLTRMEAQEAG